MIPFSSTAFGPTIVLFYIFFWGGFFVRILFHANDDYFSYILYLLYLLLLLLVIIACLLY